jgi:hypothetical protein
VFGMQSLRSKADIRHVAVYGHKNGQGRRWELAGTPEELKSVLKIIVKHPPKERFPRYNPYPNVVLGDWDNDIVKVDWDERNLVEVKQFSRLMNERYHLDGFIILQSSTRRREIRTEDLTRIAYRYKTKSYHTVFNRPVSLNEMISILAWLCLFTKDNKLVTWFLLQLIKDTFTLRVGFKKRKKPPRIVCRYGNQNRQIAKFLANREFILDFLRRR